MKAGRKTGIHLVGAASCLLALHSLSSGVVYAFLLLGGGALLNAPQPAKAGLGPADLNTQDVERFTGRRTAFNALCGTSKREEKCTVQILKDRLVVNQSNYIYFSTVTQIIYGRGGDDPGPIGHRLWGKGYDQTGVFYTDESGSKKLAVFAFRHAATWMHFNLNLVAAKNGIYFQN